MPNSPSKSFAVRFFRAAAICLVFALLQLGNDQSPDNRREQAERSNVLAGDKTIRISEDASPFFTHLVIPVDIARMMAG